MFRSVSISVSIVAATLGVSAQAGPPTSVSIRQLAPHDCLQVRTAQYVLKLEIVDPATGEALASLASDGVHFGQVDRVFLLGATKGRNPEGLMFVNMGRLEVGKGIELAVHTLDPDNRRVTAPVESFELK